MFSVSVRYLLFFVATMSWLHSSCKTLTRDENELLESSQTMAFKKDNAVTMTPVQNQGTVNYCWAYGLLGMVEGLHKKRTGEELTLSPHALV